MTSPVSRFTEKPALYPSAVMSLPRDHAAMSGNSTLFPTTVVTVTADEPDRLLVSGANNRKLGDRVAKGRFKGYALFGLSLEERATCPRDCSIRGACYGNDMQMARRHRIGDADVFFARMESEIDALLGVHDGLLIRLHVLGDFPSVEYVAFWSDVLREHERVAIYGYTHRRLSTDSGDDIGDSIAALKQAFPERFRVRWSADTPKPDGAVVVDYVPAKPRIEQGIVCPAQTDAAACCASCGLCWEPAARHETVVFIKHGRTSIAVAARKASAPAAEPAPSAFERESGVAEFRRVSAIELPRKGKAQEPKPIGALPEFEIVAPTDLQIEPRYQRDLTAKSMKLIRRIVDKWDWTKFKPPICARASGGLFVIDGQHTAIAAATRGVAEIPVLIVDEKHIERRAGAFVSHNRDRIAMSPFQVFHAECAANDASAMAVLRIAVEAGATIPRGQIAKGYAKVGDVVSIAELRSIYTAHGAGVTRRVLKIAVLAGLAPIGTTVTRALRMIVTEPYFAGLAALPDADIADVIRKCGDIDSAAWARAFDTGEGRHRACAKLIAEAVASISLAEVA